MYMSATPLFHQTGMRPERVQDTSEMHAGAHLEHVHVTLELYFSHLTILLWSDPVHDILL